MSNLSRRSLLTSAAALPALAMPAAVAAVPVAAAMPAVASPAIAERSAADPAPMPTTPVAADPDAELIALGERLKAASAEAERLAPDRRLYDECWAVSGFDKSPKGRANEAAQRRFDATAKRNGYAAACKKWNVAGWKESRIAKAILKLPSHTRIGDGVRAAATIVDGSGIDTTECELLHEMAAQAGFTPPPDVAKKLKQKGLAVPTKPSHPDPIFAAIDAHRKAIKETNEQEEDDEADRFADIETAVMAEMLSAAPTSLAGALALSRYAVELNERGYQMHFVDPRNPDGSMEWNYFVHEAIASALASHVGSHHELPTLAYRTNQRQSA